MERGVEFWSWWAWESGGFFRGAEFVEASRAEVAVLAMHEVIVENELVAVFAGGQHREGSTGFQFTVCVWNEFGRFVGVHS